MQNYEELYSIFRTALIQRYAKDSRCQAAIRYLTITKSVFDITPGQSEVIDRQIIAVMIKDKLPLAVLMAFEKAIQIIIKPCSSLCEAASRGNVEIVQALLDKGRDVNKELDGNNSALALAASNGHLDVVNKLLTHHINVDIISSAVDVVSPDHPEIKEILLARQKELREYNEVINAVKEGDYDKCKAILSSYLKSGTNNSIGSSGKSSLPQTFLHMAVAANKEGSVRALLELGADPSQRDIKNIRPSDLVVNGERGIAINNLLAQALHDRLLGSIKNGDVNKVEQGIINFRAIKDADIDFLTTDGTTALHLAVLSGDSNVVHSLLEVGDAKINVRDANQQTPLEIAAQKGHADIVKLFLTKHIDVKIMQAALGRVAEDHPEIKSILQERVKELQDYSEVINVIKSGDYEQSKTAIAKYRQANKDYTIASSGVNPQRMTLLHVAVEANNPYSVRALLELGADPSRRDFNNNRPSEFLKKGEDGIVVRNLLKDALLKKFHDKISREERFMHTPKFIEDLRAVGGSLDVKNDQGKTALHMAAEKDDPSLIGLLLNNDFENVNATDSNGRTALHAIVASKDQTRSPSYKKRCLEILLKAKSLDPNVRDNNGKTALHIAVENDDVEAVHVLLALANVDSSIKDSNNKTPSMLVNAHTKNGQRIVGMLRRVSLEKMTTSEIFLQNLYQARKDTMTADQIKSMIAEYISAGGDVNGKNKIGETALHIIVQFDWGDMRSVVHQLLEAGANPLMKDFAGRIPSDVVSDFLFPYGNSRTNIKGILSRAEKNEKAQENTSPAAPDPVPPALPPLPALPAERTEAKTVEKNHLPKWTRSDPTVSFGKVRENIMNDKRTDFKTKESIINDRIKQLEKVMKEKPQMEKYCQAGIGELRKGIDQINEQKKQQAIEQQQSFGSSQRRAG